VATRPRGHTINPNERLFVDPGPVPFNWNAVSGLTELIHATTNGNGVRWDAREPAGQFAFGNVIPLLNRMGIDTSRDFTVNGVRFEVSNNVIQTRNFTAPQPDTPTGMGIEGLKALVARAYEQNIFYVS